VHERLRAPGPSVPGDVVVGDEFVIWIQAESVHVPPHGAGVLAVRVDQAGDEHDVVTYAFAESDDVVVVGVVESKGA